MLVFLFLLASLPGAHAIEYFNDGIEYWPKLKPKVRAEKAVKEASKPQETKKFDWTEHLDENHPSQNLFKEGDYTPPAPFIEVAKNPTDKNIGLWLKYIEKKNLLATRLQTRLKKYLAKKKITMPQKMNVQLKRETVQVDPGRYIVRTYFDSKCPACKQFMPTLKRLQDRGLYIELMQIDDGSIRHLNLPFPVKKATSQLVKKEGIKAVPYTLIADLKKKVILPAIKGVRSESEILNIIKLSKN